MAKHFYFELIPEARRYNNPEVNAYIDRLLRDDPMHRWVNERTDGLKKQDPLRRAAEYLPPLLRRREVSDDPRRAIPEFVRGLSVNPVGGGMV